MTQIFYDRVADSLIQDQERLYRLAYSYTYNTQDALDIVQSAAVKALTARPLREPEYIRTWVYRIVVNTALDWLRRNKRLVPADDSFFEDQDAPADAPADMDLQQALNRLPANYRTVVVLRFFEEFKLEEIAQITSTNVNTVKTRLYRALEMMRVEMEGVEDD
ncbi:MAG: RNA polymerase sigma factor [Anaerolineae bacterium]|nr:sigma-70 family RNA polymerase sigma factor [Chloroflexota bacterium]